MFEKKAEDFLKKSLKVDDDEFDFFKNESSCKEEIKRLTDFVEPREKRIAELEKACDETQKLLDKQIEETYKVVEENTELKDKLKPENCLKLLAKEGYIKFSSEQLTKAKELLTRFVMASVYFNGKETDLIAEAEQFLKECE